ncbi:hypothetical protein V8C35DRAFT_325810 [Trichoderma chlorosporum]
MHLNPKRAQSTARISAAQKSISPRQSASRGIHNSSHADGGVDRELDTLSNPVDDSMKEFQSKDADHIVIRAYKAIVNVMNLRWSLTGLQSQASLFAVSKKDQLDNPGARLFALRSKLRNEQHMAVAIDRVAAVLLVDMRDDLGVSYDGVRERGFRTAAMGNKMLAEQWGKTHKEVIEEIRAAITYNFAEQIISPGINLLLGSRSQDVWEKRFSRKKVEALCKLLNQTEEGRIALSRAKDLDDAVITIKCILSVHIGYYWRCKKYASLNTQESSEVLFKKLHGQLSMRATDMRHLGSTLYSTLDKPATKSRQIPVFSEKLSDSFVQAARDTTTSSSCVQVSIEKRKLSMLPCQDHPLKKCRHSLDTKPSSDTSHIIDGLPLMVRPVTNQEQDGKRASSADEIDTQLDFVSQNSYEDDQMPDLAGDGNIQSDMENTYMDRGEDMTEHQPELQDSGSSLAYQYGEQWGIAEDVTTLDDILSLSW